jgi:hypothetical protein
MGSVWTWPEYEKKKTIQACHCIGQVMRSVRIWLWRSARLLLGQHKSVWGLCAKRRQGTPIGLCPCPTKWPAISRMRTVRRRVWQSWICTEDLYVYIALLKEKTHYIRPKQTLYIGMEESVTIKNRFDTLMKTYGYHPAATGHCSSYAMHVSSTSCDMHVSSSSYMGITLLPQTSTRGFALPLPPWPFSRYAYSFFSAAIATMAILRTGIPILKSPISWASYRKYTRALWLLRIFVILEVQVRDYSQKSYMVWFLNEKLPGCWILRIKKNCLLRCTLFVRRNARSRPLRSLPRPLCLR